MSGDQYDKYKATRRAAGKLNLNNPIWEAALHQLASGIPKDELSKYIPEMTPEETEKMLADPAALQRLKYKTRQLANRKYVPDSPDECLAFVKKGLAMISKARAVHAKDKVSALKALGEVAIDERKNGSPSKPPAQVSDELKKAFENKGRPVSE